jgi:uncharacterized membrane protein
VIWAAVLAACVGCYLLKLAGLLLPQRLLERPAVSGVADLLPVALLASLVVVQAVTQGQALVVDARLAGVAVAAGALLLRAPFLVVVGLAAATAALLRALGAG